MALKPKPFPKGMGACADLLHDLREDRLAADKVAAALKVREEELKTHIINNLPKDSGGAIGQRYKVDVDRKKKMRVKDWPIFYAYVAKTKAWDLVQKRLAEQALADRLADGKKVPGLEPFDYVSISLTKR